MDDDRWTGGLCVEGRDTEEEVMEVAATETEG